MVKSHTRDKFGSPITVDVCCKDFAKAMEPGTDNEGYGSLISVELNRYYTIGCGELDEIEYCPWCGKPVRSPVITAV